MSVRIGATSFVLPGTWAENVAHLAGRVDDVELLFFEADGLPDAAELEALADWKRRAGLSYTVHTPLSASLASLDPRRRRRGVDEVRRVVELTRALDPWAWILHVYGGDAEGEPIPDDEDAWRRRARDSLGELCTLAPAERLCVESLVDDLGPLAPVLDELGLGVALDVGHFYRDRRPVAPALRRWQERARVIQWHGTGDRDHQSLAHVSDEDGRWLLAELSAAGWSGVLTLEVFRDADLRDSLDRVRRWSGEIRGGRA